MAILGSILKRTFEIRERMPKIRRVNGYKKQQKVLRKLLTKAEFTALGEHYNFSKILSEVDVISAFQERVDTHDYNSMFKKWWYRALNGEANVTWPRRVKYFALSSGTSEAASKYIPVTSEMLRAIQRGSMRQILSQGLYNFPKEHYERGFLMLGGSTQLNYNGIYYEGDLSGITAKKIPFFFQRYYKPGNDIAKGRNWEQKLEEITLSAKDWDIGVVVGVPAWIQILFEKIIDHYKVESIHDIWPNFAVYVHGGVAIEPYKKGFEKLMSKPVVFCNSYLASEGYLGYQNRPDATGIALDLDNGIFFEFVPFTAENFDEDGNICEKPQTLHIGQVEEGVEYAILISTVAGAWRYLIGDVVRFTSLPHHEIAIAGRTRQYLSLCGEHLSVDNMNRAIELAAEELNVEIKEFTVAGVSHGSLFAHHWYVGVDEPVDAAKLRELIDSHLKVLNDDYAVERTSALKEVIVDVLPSSVFYDYLQKRVKKVGAATKFPRVIKNKDLQGWLDCIAESKK